MSQVKADNATNDAIIDDTAGQAYVEQFALGAFCEILPCSGNFQCP
jgi:vacuolar protein sorting-associated protein VTA1